MATGGLGFGRVIGAGLGLRVATEVGCLLGAVAIGAWRGASVATGARVGATAAGAVVATLAGCGLLVGAGELTGAGVGLLLGVTGVGAGVGRLTGAGALRVGAVTSGTPSGAGRRIMLIKLLLATSGAVLVGAVGAGAVAAGATAAGAVATGAGAVATGAFAIAAGAFTTGALVTAAGVGAGRVVAAGEAVLAVPTGLRGALALDLTVVRAITALTWLSSMFLSELALVSALYKKQVLGDLSLRRSLRACT